MLAYEFGNSKESLKMIYELDTLIHSVISNSSCKDMDSMGFLKLIDGKHPMLQDDRGRIYFNSTDDMELELGSTPAIMAFNNQKLINA